MIRRLLVVPLFILLTAEACTSAHTTPAARASAASSYQSLVDHLRAAGVEVEPAGEVEQPFFTPKARVIRIGTPSDAQPPGGEAQVYEYANEELAAADAARVQPDGSIEGAMPHWIAPPHFFRRRNLLVLYLGSDETTLLNLRGFLGNEFAGQR
jgi:hypothetical protein